MERTMKRLISVLFLVTAVSSNPHHAKGHTGGDDTVDLNEYRMDAVAQKFFKIGSTESCPPNMRFFAVPDSENLGQCDCDHYDCSRPLIYNQRTRQCHWAWSKGPCKTGEWYTFTTSLKAVCDKNPCPKSGAVEGSIQYFFTSPTDGKCYEAATKGYCKGKDETLAIYPYEPIPTCRTATVCYPLSRPATQRCIPGHRRALEGLCTQFTD